MPEQDGLMRIFWPLDVPRTESPGIIVGWRNSGLDVCVVAVLEDIEVSFKTERMIHLADAKEARNVENALKMGTLFRGAGHPIQRIYELCGQSSMQVLGLTNSPSVEIDHLQMHATIKPGLKVPQISCARASTIQIIMFERPSPNRMQYISLDPISLALGDKIEKTIHEPGSIDAEEEKEELKARKKTRDLVEKLKLHTVTKHPPSQKEKALPWIVNQINCSFELHKLLQKNISLIGRRSRRSLSVSERVVESATSMRDWVVMAIWQLITVYIYPILRRGFVIGLVCHRIVAEALLLVLEWRPKPDYAALKDISATAQQVEIRLQQFCYWPMQ
jgi:phosphatidylinositol glycan class Q protein